MDNLKDFLSKFFRNLGCGIDESEDSLIISNIPASFEKFSGKKGPYLFCFNHSLENHELINSNHYLIGSIKDFLDGRGETTLLKLDVNFDPKKELNNIIPLKNCEIKSFSKSYDNQFLFKFSFATMFQYLNEREQVINNVYVRNGEIINFDESCKLLEGNKRDLKEIVFDKEYELAKMRLKEITLIKKESLSLKLNDLLEKEISRIKLHYKNNSDELKIQRDSLIHQAENSEGDKLKKIEKMISKFDEEFSLKNFEDEEKTFIEHEFKKHTLSIKNKLLNVSVIYFPVYKINLVLNSGKDNRMIQIDYDSVLKDISPLFCLSCKKQVDEIILCSSGHITCRDCGDRCEVCDGINCKICQDKVCRFCNKKICSGCAEICEGCKEYFCKNHAFPINNSGKKLCRNCIKRCHDCGLMIEPGFSKKIAENFYCLKCFNIEKSKRILDDVFER